MKESLRVIIKKWFKDKNNVKRDWKGKMGITKFQFSHWLKIDQISFIISKDELWHTNHLHRSNQTTATYPIKPPVTTTVATLPIVAKPALVDSAATRTTHHQFSMAKVVGWLESGFLIGVMCTFLCLCISVKDGGWRLYDVGVRDGVKEKGR